MAFNTLLPPQQDKQSQPAQAKPAVPGPQPPQMGMSQPRPQGNAFGFGMRRPPFFPQRGGGMGLREALGQSGVMPGRAFGGGPQGVAGQAKPSGAVQNDFSGGPSGVRQMPMQPPATGGGSSVGVDAAMPQLGGPMPPPPGPQIAPPMQPPSGATGGMGGLQPTGPQAPAPFDVGEWQRRTFGYNF